MNVTAKDLTIMLGFQARSEIYESNLETVVILSLNEVNYVT